MGGAHRRLPPPGPGDVLLDARAGRDRLTALAVAVDGSQPAEAALEAAVELARACAARLLLVHVATGEAGDKGRRILDEAGRRATEASVPWYAELVTGVPAEAILELARRADVDAVVLGSRGRGGVAGEALGSVSKAVLERADRPVLIVRGL